MGMRAAELWLSVDLCVVPIGVGVSLSPHIATRQRVVASAGLIHELGLESTAIEGHLNDVMNRVYTTLKLNTRIDRHQGFLRKG